jgi:hypothetical protein
MQQTRNYRKKVIQPMYPYISGEALHPNVTVALDDREKGSPKPGDMIAVNPKDSSNRWLVEAKFFEDNYEIVE